MNVAIPGTAVFICWTTLASWPTDCRIGRSPVCTAKYLSWAAEVSQIRNCSAAAARAEPLLKTTQLSGPEMVWWPPLVPG